MNVCGLASSTGFAADSPLADQRLAFLPRDANGVPRGEPVHHEKTQIMGCRGVLLAGIAKTGDQKHSRLFLLAFFGCRRSGGFVFLLALLRHFRLRLRPPRVQPRLLP